MNGKRKFILFLVSLFVVSIFLAVDKLSGAEFTELVKAIFFIFVGGNAVEHIYKKPKVLDNNG